MVRIGVRVRLGIGLCLRLRLWHRCQHGVRKLRESA